MKACIIAAMLFFACTRSTPPAATITATNRVWTMEQATTPPGVKKCACGDYPTMYEYYVKEGTGCCTGPVLADWPAKKLTYARSGNMDTWQLMNEEKMEAVDVQQHCCKEK